MVNLVGLAHFPQIKWAEPGELVAIRLTTHLNYFTSQKGPRVIRKSTSLKTEYLRASLINESKIQWFFKNTRVFSKCGSLNSLIKIFIGKFQICRHRDFFYRSKFFNHLIKLLETSKKLHITYPRKCLENFQEIL